MFRHMRTRISEQQEIKCLTDLCVLLRVNTHAGALVELNNFINPFEKIRDTGVN